MRNSGADQENPRLAALEARAKTEPKAAYDRARAISGATA
ncbi:conserved hypothetical protein [Burkholderia pseudomallei Pakistan 9]|nr:conserved hypothetical protein [Burkholderia pseudomallei Pakistan 9]